ncbi:MAG: DUF7151 family protein [Nitrospirota bacterium]
MRKGSELLLAVFLAALIMSAGCKQTDSPDLSKLGPSSAATSTVLPVGSPLCPGGGIGIYTGSDTNGNGLLDAAEILKGAPVCGPLSEAGKPEDGIVSLVMIASEPTGTLHCLAGGLKVQSGPDGNRNAVLDAGEVAFTEYLCNGAPGAGSAAGITVAVEPPAPPADGKKKKNKKQAAPAKPGAAAGKASAKAASRPAAEAPGDPAASTNKAAAKDVTASPNREKGGSAKPAAPPKGWTAVKAGNPQLAKVVYKVEGRYITVRFTNLSASSSVRFKYTVRWKVNQNGAWVDDSTMEGIGFRLQPQETLDREVRVQTQDIRDVVVDLDVLETS